MNVKTHIQTVLSIPSQKVQYFKKEGDALTLRISQKEWSDLYDLPETVVDPPLTHEPIPEYRPVQELRDIIKALAGQKFMLECGHKVTFGCNLGQDLVLLNGKEPKIICSECGM